MMSYLNDMENSLIVGKKSTDTSVVQEIYVDPSSTLIVITYEHARVHRGQFYTCGYYATGIDNNDSIEILMQAGNADVHTYVNIASGGDSTFSVFEGVTITNAGTSITAFNHNRTSSNTPTVTTTHTPTISDYGTQLGSTEFIPGGTQPHSVGILASVGAEQLVLSSNEDYIIRLTNTAGSAKALNINISFYEV